MEKPAGVRLTWLGHAGFRMLTPGGQTILLDPWLKNNPACPAPEKTQAKADLLLITHGHFDHFEDALDLARSLRPKVVANFEICQYLNGEGIELASPMNKGGTQEINGIRITMVPASHTSSIVAQGRILPGGEAVGYVLEFENGFKVYHAGDTTVFSDMRLIAELYRPDLSILPIGDLFTMGPREAAMACRLLRPPRLIPVHYGTFPPLSGRPDQLRELTPDLPEMEIIALKPGETWASP